jgi:hypothetical protein
MRASRILWTLSFEHPPGPEVLRELARRLDVDVPPVPGGVSSDGLYVVELRDVPVVRDAGRIALACLEKGHRLGSGWRVLWPGVPRFPGGYRAEDMDRAGRAEFLDGLEGGFRGTSELPGLHAASFRVELLAEVEAPRPTAEPVRVEAPVSAAPASPELVRALDDALSAHRDTPWLWRADMVRRQVLRMGYVLNDDDDLRPGYRHASGRRLELRIAGDWVRSIHVVLERAEGLADLDEGGRDRVVQAQEDAFRSAARHLEGRLGRPAFIGAAGEAGFPGDQAAEWAAVWPGPGGRLMLQQHQDDRETPADLCMVFAPIP